MNNIVKYTTYITQQNYKHKINNNLITKLKKYVST